ncbi:TRAP transporter substrate-binding protein DctP [Acidocella sp. KAb 2-4]|uniref:TRAP transporter substrate-binding protein DctP n=1 Tax=Acidocella sp. KAb 2-4 TaxID=2885158 RepID=UPI001D066F94|nr:TRAP transporter substrate-binding protein DctP [Acidocella sp. KAb 2-4]MCB5945906.1 TRAP transporter substrate-binding protein DctP [Acidocella sp. KAb 2-4]
MNKAHKNNAKKIAKFSRKFGSLALIGALAVASGARASTTLVLSPLQPPQDDFNTKVMDPWAKDVATVTGGQVTVKILPMDVAPPAQLVSAVQSDVADMAYLFNGLVANKFPLVQIAGLPFLSPSAEASSVALWNTYQKYFAGKGEYKQVKLLALYCEPTGQLFSMGQPFESTDDFKGKKLLALPGPTQLLLSNAGIAVQSAPAVQMSEFVSSGAVDGVAGLSTYNANDFKLMPYMKSETVIPGGVSGPCFSLVINKEKWASIPKQYQDAIESISGVNFAHRLSALDQVTQADEKNAVTNGFKLISPSQDLMASLQAAAKPQYTNWLSSANNAGVNGQEVLEYFEAQLKSGKE